MKNKHITIALLALLALTATACELDNYQAPSYVFEGQLLCDGEPFPFDANRGLLRLYQEGYGKVDGGTEIRTNEQGHFRQLLFDTDYKLTLVNQKLPFEMPDFPSRGEGRGYDTLAYNITQNVTQNFEVRPYYKIQNVSAVVENNNIVATFNVVRNSGTQLPAPALSKARLYISTSALVNSNVKCNVSQNITDPNASTLRVSIPLSVYRDKNNHVNNFRTYAFYRVAVELQGISSYYLFSDVQKIENLPL